MLALKRIVDFYIFSNIHVAIAGFCICKITLLKYNVYNNLTPFFVGFSIIISYNLIRFYEIKSKRLSWFKVWFQQCKNLLITLVVFSSGSLLYLTFFTSFNLNSLIVLFPFTLMTFFYVIPIFKTKNTHFSFRYFPSLKIFSIAISWAGISVLFPVAEASIPIDAFVILEFLKRFLILLAITIPFDIRDLDSDIETLKTLPQLLGISNAKKVGIIALIFFVFLGIRSNQYLIAEVIISIITGLFLWFSSIHKSRYYTSFWVESIPILWFFIILLKN